MIQLSFPESYDLIHTFECGQTFRFVSFDDGNTYYGPYGDRILKIRQVDAQTLEIDSNITKGLESITEHFFRREDDYFAIQNVLAIDDLMQKIIQTTNGLHIIRQEKFECTIAYFLSQCSNIPRIKLHLTQFAHTWGSQVEYDGHSFELFPTRDDLQNVTEDLLREMHMGYRAKFIAKFIHEYPEWYDNPPTDSDTLNSALQSIDGIGPKVADCIQLMIFGDLSVFPVDTWMEKFMKRYYLTTGKPNLKKIRECGRELFGKYAGYAQEFIFHYARCYDAWN